MEKSAELAPRRPLAKSREYISKRLLKIIVLIVIVVVIVLLPPALGVHQAAYYQAVLIGGVLTGGVYVLIATGLTLIMGVMKIVNICHGDFVILAAYLSFWMDKIYGLDPILSVVISIPLLFAAGIPIQRLLFSRGLKLGVDTSLIVAFGLSNILQYSMVTAWGVDARIASTSYSTSVLSVGPVLVPVMRLVVLGVAALCVIVVTIFLKKTYLGMAVRATGMDWEIASHFGIDTERVNMLAYSIGLSLAAVAGALISLVLGFTSSSGVPLMLKGFAAIVLGGVGSVPGALVGGIILGYAESTGSFFLGSEYTNLIGFSIFFVVLLLRPWGLLGRRESSQ